MTPDALQTLIERSRELKASSTKVVAWYAHSYPATVRGPYVRWLECTEVLPEYKKHVADSYDDVKYAAHAMNNLPALIEIIEVLLREAQHVSEINCQPWCEPDGVTCFTCKSRQALTRAQQLAAEALK